ncbi:hypothetical protein EYF80_039424 [Liparis tanakae]|uniref:Uncharacterized protein n=1 Tax=Liparis tanakae TaxID=230148 RepID=A0A4Z2GAE2_9TELE|nr:hypothetical protein EYF80_039424 [Liparis tanakae]
MDMQALFPTIAPHLLSSQRLGYYQARPPGVSLQFCPHKGTSIEWACVAAERSKNFPLLLGFALLVLAGCCGVSFACSFGEELDFLTEEGRSASAGEGLVFGFDLETGGGDLLTNRTVLGYPLADSDSCFCMMASATLLEAAKSFIEIISPDSLRPSVSLSQGPSESGGRLLRPLAPGRMALRLPRRTLALLQRWQNKQLIFSRIQLSTCLMTIEMTLKRE